MERTYTLKTPITLRLVGPQGEREEVVHEVTIRTPKARDLRCLDNHTGDVAKAMAMIEQLTELSPKVVGELAVEDFTALGEIVGSFFQNGLTTGAMS